MKYHIFKSTILWMNIDEVAVQTGKIACPSISAPFFRKMRFAGCLFETV